MLCNYKYVLYLQIGNQEPAILPSDKAAKEVKIK